MVCFGTIKSIKSFTYKSFIYLTKLVSLMLCSSLEARGEAAGRWTAGPGISSVSPASTPAV